MEGLSISYSQMPFFFHEFISFLLFIYFKWKVKPVQEQEVEHPSKSRIQEMFDVALLFLYI